MSEYDDEIMRGMEPIARERKTEVNVTSFGDEVEVSWGRCPLCGSQTQFVSASLLEVRVTCYCNTGRPDGDQRLSVIAESEEALDEAWRKLQVGPQQLAAWHPFRYEQPMPGRYLVSTVKDGQHVVTIARYADNGWVPPIHVDAWAILPEPWA